MKRYSLDFLTDENGIKLFKENSNKLIVWDIPKNRKNWINNEILKTNNQLTGIYLLINNEREDNKNEIYVGESDNVARRILNHISNDQKNFNRVIIIYSDSNNYKLNKDQIRYLEKKLISHFKEFPTKWINNENKEGGKNIKLTFIDKKELNNHFEFILYALKLFDYDISYSYENDDTISTVITKDEIENKEVDQVDVWMKSKINKKNIRGKYISNGNKGFIELEEGIKFKTKLTNNRERSINNFIRALKKYKKEGKIDWDESLDLLKDIISITIIEKSLFTPSGIGALIIGHEVSGYLYWKDKNGDNLNKYRK